MAQNRRFSTRQITVIAVAVCVAVIALPVGVYAATTGSSVNITDPVNAAHKAGVDGSGKLLVGDGTGALTIDGAVSTRSADQTVTLWSYQLIPNNGWRTPVLTVAGYGQVRVSAYNISSGPCTIYVSSSASQYAVSRLQTITLAQEPFSPDSFSTVFDVPGRTMSVYSDSCEAEVEVYARP